MTRVTIPSLVTSIGDAAFFGWGSLTSLEIPLSVTSIGRYAFRWCIPLTSLEIPSSVTSIESGAFEGCRSLASLTIPSSVTSIDYCAFFECSSLESLTISSSIPIIMGNAFAGCTKLATLAVFRPYAGGRAACTAPTVHKTAFENCPNINVVSAPDVVVEAFGPPYDGCSTFGSLPPRVTLCASKPPARNVLLEHETAPQHEPALCPATCLGQAPAYGQIADPAALEAGQQRAAKRVVYPNARAPAVAARDERHLAACAQVCHAGRAWRLEHVMPIVSFSFFAFFFHFVKGGAARCYAPCCVNFARVFLIKSPTLYVMRVGSINNI